jgi:hypothetical protein
MHNRVEGYGPDVRVTARRPDIIEGPTVDPHMVEVEIQHRAKVRVKVEAAPSLRIPTDVQRSANGSNRLGEPSAHSDRKRGHLLSVKRARCEDSKTRDKSYASHKSKTPPY